MVRARHANCGAVPKESRLANECIARGTIYVGIRICTKYSFFVKPTVGRYQDERVKNGCSVRILKKAGWSFRFIPHPVVPPVHPSLRPDCVPPPFISRQWSQPPTTTTGPITKVPSSTTTSRSPYAARLVYSAGGACPSSSRRRQQRQHRTTAVVDTIAS